MPNNPAQMILPLSGISSADELPRELITYCTCPACENKFDEEEGLTLSESGELHCEECVCTCQECFNVILNDDSREAFSDYRRRDSVTVCDGCGWKCADCDNVYTDNVNPSSNTCGDDVCPRCAENYTYCEACETTIHSEDSRYDEEEERTLCEHCMRSVEAEREDDEVFSPRSRSRKLIERYTYKPAPEFRVCADETQTTSTVYYGLEIEVDNGPSSHDYHIRGSGLVDDGSPFYCKHDGSLTNGFEIVSHPATFAYWQAHAFTWAAKLKSAGYRSYDTSTCGMHVHVSRSALSTCETFKLLAFAKQNAHFMYRASRRKSEDGMNRWAAVDSSATGELVRKAKRELTDDDKRYCAINLLPRNTIEFRLFRGTLDVRAIKRNIAFVAALIGYVRDASLAELSPLGFVAWIRERGSAHIGGTPARELHTWINTKLRGERDETWVDEDTD